MFKGQAVLQQRVEERRVSPICAILLVAVEVPDEFPRKAFEDNNNDIVGPGFQRVWQVVHRGVHGLEFVFRKILYRGDVGLAQCAEQRKGRIQHNANIARVARILAGIAERNGTCAFPETTPHATYSQVDNDEHRQEAATVVRQATLHQRPIVVESLVYDDQKHHDQHQKRGSIPVVEQKAEEEWSQVGFVLKLPEDIGGSATKGETIVDKVRHIHCQRGPVRDKEPDRQSLLKARVEPIVQRNDEQEDEQYVGVEDGRQVQLQSSQHQVHKVSERHVRKERRVV